MNTSPRHLRSPGARLLVACCCAALIAVPGVLASVPVAADVPQPVTATFQVDFSGETHGTFSATAPLPTSGTFVDTSLAPAIRVQVVHVTRVMTAAGGTVDATWTAKIDGPNTADGNWVITGGTGAYAHMQAHGTTSIVLTPGVSGVENWQGSSP